MGITRETIAPWMCSRCATLSGNSSTPMPGLVTLPFSMSWVTTFLMTSTGMANPIPALAPLGLKIAVFIPMRRPRESRSGPPELPGLIEASVWMTSAIVRCVSDLISRPSALTTPVVRVWSRPKGLPMARTVCPTRTSCDVPGSMGVSLSAGTSILRTAMSLSG